MLERGITSGRALARKAELSEGAVNRILAGTREHPDHDTLVALAKAFSMTVDELTTGRRLLPSPLESGAAVWPPEKLPADVYGERAAAIARATAAGLDERAIKRARAMKQPRQKGAWRSELEWLAEIVQHAIAIQLEDEQEARERDEAE